MKVMTLFGTRPEIIRLSQVVRILDEFCEQVLVHTGQNHDPSLSDVFFNELEVRHPDFHLGVQGVNFAQQASQILERAGAVFESVRPDRLLILGDTNSGLAAVVAARMGIPVFHMEAGNRCYDNRVPEETNRRIIDHCSNVLMPYTNRSKDNLLREGIERQRIYVIGNPIYEVLNAYTEKIAASDILSKLNLTRSGFFLVSLHRAENVDNPERLANFFRGLSLVADTYSQPMVVSLHPRTADKLLKSGINPDSDRLKLLTPLGFFDFIKLEQNAFCVLSDSGTVQEECCIFKVPNITLRDVTERAETVECGSNILTGVASEMILRAVQIATKLSCDWTPPAEYLERDVSTVVTKIVLGYQQ